MERLKISDGDMVIVTLHGKVDHKFSRHMVETFEKWINARGLNNVELVMLNSNGGGDDMSKETITVKVLSVNDVFEGTVLK